jgi:hypothetical protein
MKIHGLRIYPQSVDILEGDGAPIFVHGSVSDDCSDFYYIFRPTAHLWCGHFFANDFGVSYEDNGRLKNPVPGLRKEFGANFVTGHLDIQTLVLRGDGFDNWGRQMNFCEAAYLPIFRETPTFELLKRVCWDPKFRLASETWPNEMRAMLHMWDDMYWQLFTTNRSDLDALIRAHTGDPKIKMYSVELDREFPDPSNQELQPATLSNET